MAGGVVAKKSGGLERTELERTEIELPSPPEADGPGDHDSPGDGLLGRSVGNYRVERKIGSGGMGAVYLLKHDRLPNTYAALKVLTPEAAAISSVHDRFRQEAMIAAVVGHHRVARPLDIGDFPDGTPYIVMEYIDGRSLADELKDGGPLSLVSALRIAFRVADTLVPAHEKGIVHRDIKPGNIMVVRMAGREDGVKVLDFGVARASGEIKIAQTSEHIVVGTWGYMAPEVLAARPVDGRADVFSLGVVLYKSLAGTLPFPIPREPAALLRFLTAPPPPIRQRRPAALDHVPGWVEEILFRALARERDDRYTMAEFRDALRGALRRLQELPEAHTSTSPSLAPLLAATSVQPELESVLDEVSPARDVTAAPPAVVAGPAVAICAASPIAREPVRRGRIALMFLGAAALIASAGVALTRIASQSPGSTVAAPGRVVAAPDLAVPAGVPVSTANAALPPPAVSSPAGTAPKGPAGPKRIEKLPPSRGPKRRPPVSDAPEQQQPSDGSSDKRTPTGALILR